MRCLKLLRGFFTKCFRGPQDQKLVISTKCAAVTKDENSSTEVGSSPKIYISNETLSVATPISPSVQDENSAAIPTLFNNVDEQSSEVEEYISGLVAGMDVEEREIFAEAFTYILNYPSEQENTTAIDPDQTLDSSSEMSFSSSADGETPHTTRSSTNSWRSIDVPDEDLNNIPEIPTIFDCMDSVALQLADKLIAELEADDKEAFSAAFATSLYYHDEKERRNTFVDHDKKDFSATFATSPYYHDEKDSGNTFVDHDKEAFSVACATSLNYHDEKERRTPFWIS